MSSRKKQSARRTRARTDEANAWWRNPGTVLLLLVVLAGTFAVMSPALQHGFVAWDDDVNVYENASIRVLDGEGLTRIFTQPVIGNYNPLTILTFAVEYKLFGLDPHPYHLHNIILHVLNTLLAFWLATLLGLKRPWALLVAALFGMHPMRVESVAWVTERKDVLFVFFYFVGFVAYAAHRRAPRAWKVAVVYAAFVLSLLSKIQAVSFPLALLLIDYVLHRPLDRRALLEKIPYFALSLATGLVGLYFLRQQQSLDTIQYGIFERVLIGCYSLMVYLAKAAFPYKLSAIYPFPKPGQIEPVFYAAPLLIAAVLWLLLRAYRRGRRSPAFGLLFFFVTVAFVLQVVSAGQGFITDRFTYLPYFGLFFFAATFASSSVERMPRITPVLAGVLGVYLVVLAVLTVQRVAVWRDTETLFTNVLEQDRSVAVAFNNRARFYRERKDFVRATADYTALLALTPQDAKTYVGRGRMYFEMQQYDKAMVDFTRAVELDPNNAMAHSNKGAVSCLWKQYDTALAELSRAIALDPVLKDAYSNRALLLYEMGRYEQAIADCGSYLKITRESADMRNLRAVCLGALGRHAEALAEFDEVLRLSPNSGLFYQNRSLEHNKAGDKARALADARHAASLGAPMDAAYVKSLGE
jgi:protein O-mannosyl-transferase